MGRTERMKVTTRIRPQENVTLLVCRVYHIPLLRLTLDARPKAGCSNVPTILPDLIQT